MTTKEYLSQIKDTDKHINTMLKELETLESLEYAIKCINNAERVQVSHENNSNKTVDKIVDLKAEINAEIDTLVDLKRKVKGEIEMVKNSLYVDLLTNRYINGLTFEQCAFVMKYDVRHIHRLHRNALSEYEKCVIECHYRSVL